MNAAVDTLLELRQDTLALLIIFHSRMLDREGLALTEWEEEKVIDLVKAPDRAKMLKTFRPDFKNRLFKILLNSVYKLPDPRSIPLAGIITAEIIRLREVIADDLPSTIN